MTPSGDLPLDQRLVQLFDHLDVARAHVAATAPGDYTGLVATSTDRIASLTLLCPPFIVAGTLAALADRVLVISGERDRPATQAQEARAAGTAVEHAVLAEYVDWSDVAAEHAAAIAPPLLAFLDRHTEQAALPAATLPSGEGELAGISYRIEGTGPPLVLLPLGYAFSQWDPLLPALRERYCTIELGGPALGVITLLEARATGGYVRVFRELIDEVALRPGERVLDVGCGSGALDRWLVRSTAGANPIVAVDQNRYFLREAAALARSEGVEHAIKFREGNAEALPFPDASFDVSLSCTVMEEGDADQMLAELVRVTTPGGRVGIIVRARDLSWWLNAPVSAELKATLQAPGHVPGAAAERGCADASLYQCCRAAGLALRYMSPQYGARNHRTGPAQALAAAEAFMPGLEPEAIDELRRAVVEAEADGTLFIAAPYHCAVGQKH
jgi:SAM-dependent methyltransferase